jgi:hypothetical protein
VPASQLCHNPLYTNNDHDCWVQWKSKELPYKCDIIPRYRECFHNVSGHLSSHERLSLGMPSSVGNIKSPFLPFNSAYLIPYKCREMPTSSFWAGLIVLKHVTHGLFSRFEYCNVMPVYALRRGNILMKCEGLVVVPLMITIFWDVMMFGLEGNYWLLQELAATIFRLDVLGSSLL